MPVDPHGAASGPATPRPDDPPAIVPRLAASVVLLRPGPAGPEVLLTHRPATMAFGPGLHVFPGGAVDPADAEPALIGRLRPAAPSASSASTHGGAVAVAAIRELFEEVGVLLATPGPGPTRDAVDFAAVVADGGLELRADWLVPLSRWVTPPGVPRRFDARFFVATMPPGAAVTADAREVAAHAWMTPRDALAAMADGRIDLWPPTSTTLQQLAAVRSLDDVRRHLAPLAEAGEPVVERMAGPVTRFGFSGAGGIPGQAVDAYLVGDRRAVVVDPGDPSDEAAEAIVGSAAAAGMRIVAILLTAPVPDHAAGAEGLALRLGVPIHAAAGARRVLPSEVVTLEDGDLLDLADVEVRVHATPGTHPDHLAFAVPAAGVVLVGDLEGPGPSRTMPGPVDEAALRRSREAIGGLGGRRLAAHRGPGR